MQNHIWKNSCLTEGLDELKVNQPDASQKPPLEALHTYTAGQPTPSTVYAEKAALQESKGNIKH